MTDYATVARDFISFFFHFIGGFCSELGENEMYFCVMHDQKVNKY